MKKRKGSKYNHNPSRQSSYTGFSSSYPGSSFGRRVSYSEKVRRRKILKVISSAVGLIAVLTFGFFIVDFMLNVSELPVKTTGQETTLSSKTPVTTQTQPQTQPVFISSDTKAFLIDKASLASTSNMLTAIQEVKGNGGGAVIIDFKDSKGYLSYDSTLEEMQTVNADENHFDTVSECISLCKKEGIKVIARIFCFKDPLAAGAFKGEYAINYMGNVGMLWLDNSRENGGKPWLNPFSENAQKYLLGIIREVCALNVDAVLLDTVQYPPVSLSKASFSGEDTAGAPSRNEALLNFIDKAVNATKDTTLICMADAQTVVNGYSKIYEGTIENCASKVLAVDLRNTTLESEIAVRGKTIVPVLTTPSDSSPYFVMP